jgi:hypothetical protein
MFATTKCVIAETVVKPLLQERLTPLGATVESVSLSGDSFSFRVNLHGLMGLMRVDCLEPELSTDGAKLHLGGIKTPVPLMTNLLQESFREPCEVDPMYAPVLAFRKPSFGQMCGLALRMMRTSSILIMGAALLVAVGAGIWLYFNHV